MSRLTVRVTTRAARDAVAGLTAEGALAVRVTAPPVDGAANAAVVRILAGALGLPTRDIALVAGANGRMKQFELPLGDAELSARLAQYRPK